MPLNVIDQITATLKAQNQMCAVCERSNLWGPPEAIAIWHKVNQYKCVAVVCSDCYPFVNRIRFNERVLNNLVDINIRWRIG